MCDDFKSRVGVGETHYGLGRTGATRQRSVIAEEGPRKGKTAAVYTDHANGRVDANVLVDPVKRTISQKGF
jgi:hypothetical protein